MDNYYVYILTNQRKTVLYIGVTNNLRLRWQQHKEKSDKRSFTSRYNCHFLVHAEYFDSIKEAIMREKELKKWRREKKNALITAHNPDWEFLEWWVDDKRDGIPE